MSSPSAPLGSQLGESIEDLKARKAQALADIEKIDALLEQIGHPAEGANMARAGSACRAKAPGGGRRPTAFEKT